MKNAPTAQAGRASDAAATLAGRSAEDDQRRVVFLAAGATWSITDDSEVCA